MQKLEWNWLFWLAIYREGNENSLKCILWSNKNLGGGPCDENCLAFLGLKFPDIGNAWPYVLTRLKVFLAFTHTIVDFPTASSLDSDFCCPVPVFFLICPNFEFLLKSCLICFPERISTKEHICCYWHFLIKSIFKAVYY